MTEKEEKILDLFFQDDIETAKVLLFDYMKEGANDIDYDFIQDIIRDENYEQTIQDMMFMHWSYDDLIRNGEESQIEIFISNMKYGEEEQIILYRDALDIKPYLDYVNSDEYVHPQKGYVIEQMNNVRDALGFPGVQQAGVRRQVIQTGQAGQYGGMWQRGGFFMTCS